MENKLFSKLLVADIECQVAYLFQTEEGILPVRVVSQLKEVFPEVTKSLIQEVVAGYLNDIKVYEYCERVGHEWVDDSFAGPEHGYMGVCCNRCGYSDGSFLY